MLSNFGITFLSITFLTSFLLIYLSFNELKTVNNKIPKKIYNFSSLQLIFTILSFLTLLAGFVVSDFSMSNVFEWFVEWCYDQWTTREHTKNTKRTPEEHPENTKRTSTEHPQNTRRAHRKHKNT